MDRLLGAFEGEKGTEIFLVQRENTVFASGDPKYRGFENLELIADRNSGFKNDPVAGTGTFDFRYGPVTGGVSEAGAYHFTTYGERIFSVGVDLFYKHRGIEREMEGKKFNEALGLSERICGNFSFSHSLALSRAVENAVGTSPSKRTEFMRMIGLELERIYNHLYVLSRLASAAAQKVLASHLLYLFEESLRTNKIFSGSRYLLNINRFGHGGIPIDVKAVEKRLDELTGKFESLYVHALSSGNFVDRLHATAVLKREDANGIGITGPSLRACGVAEDLRLSDPAYGSFEVPVKKEGDSLSRMEVRAEEIFESARIVRYLLGKIEEPETKGDVEILKAASGEGIGSSESPSGTVAYHVRIEDGAVKKVYVSTPSLFGFKAIAKTFVGQIFTDFPFTVESFGINFSDASR